MAKKTKSISKGGGGAEQHDVITATKRHEQPLQAVLLAHDWNSNTISYSYGGDDSNIMSQYEFHPLALDRPKILCPLLNTTMLDYVIHYLESQKVQELFVVCVTEAVETYLQQQQTVGHTTTMKMNMKVHVIRDTTVTNAGDALRELDKRNVVTSDPFVLLTGDVITNVDLSPAIAIHQQRHATDSSAMFTMLLKPVGGNIVSVDDDDDDGGNMMMISPLRSVADDLLIAMDPQQDNRILLYENKSGSHHHHRDAAAILPCSFLAAHGRIDIRTDLLDVGLDLCSPDVLARFSDEFDYRDIRQEFVTNSAAEEEEGLQNKLFAHIINNTDDAAYYYAARIRDARTLHAVSRDLLRRYGYPITVDQHRRHIHYSTAAAQQQQQQQQQQYVMQRHYLYHEITGRTILSRTSQLTGPGMIGFNCFVGENCHIQSSVVLGDHVHISDNCTLKDCHLWEGVHVEQGCSIQGSILADGVVVKAGAVIPTGCIIGANCVIGTNVKLPEYTRLTCVAATTQDDDGFDDDDWDSESEDASDQNPEDEKAIVSDTAVVGIDGKGRVWLPSIDVDDEEEENAVFMEQVLRSQCIGFNPANFYRERRKFQREDDDSFSDDGGDRFDNSALGDGTMGDYEDSMVTFGESPVASQPAAMTIGRQEGVDVIKELKLICLEFESATSPIENLAIELNSYKFSQNATYSDCTMAATLAIMEKMNIGKGMTDGKLASEFKSFLDQWAPLLQKMSIGLDEEKAIVLALEQCAIEDSDEAAKEMSQVLSSGMSFRLLLQMLHDEEIVSEEAILAWKADREEESVETPRGKLFRLKPVQEFLDWLDEESEEDDDGDSDESESDEG